MSYLLSHLSAFINLLWRSVKKRKKKKKNVYETSIYSFLLASIQYFSDFVHQSPELSSALEYNEIGWMSCWSIPCYEIHQLLIISNYT